MNRGVAYLDGKVFRGTSDGHVLAFDAKDGHTVWDVTLDVAGPGVTVPMAPIAWHGMVFIGNAGGDRVGVIGHVYALDAGSGRVDWRFDVVPAAGPARNTWGRGAASAYPVSGGAFWTSFTLDEPSGVLYVSSGNPAPDFDGAMRDGENLYANCLIALDAATGRMLGYNQLVKHDFHDWDVDSPSPVVTTRSGRPSLPRRTRTACSRCSIAAASRRVRRSWRHERSGSPIELPLLYQMPTTTRENVDVPLSRDRADAFLSGHPGRRRMERRGVRSARNNTLFVGANDWCTTVQLQREAAAVPRLGAAWFGNAAGGQRMDSASAAKGWLTAYDAENGHVRWKFQSARTGARGRDADRRRSGVHRGSRRYRLRVRRGRRAHALADVGRAVDRRRHREYLAGGHQRIGVASGMRSPIWPGGSQSSHIIVYGLR